jgi:glycine oxidase
VLDYLVIGQGLAGTVLSRTFSAHGQRGLVVDSGEQFSASRVAAGLFNPLTGPRMVKTWRAEALFPFLAEFYGRFAQDLGAGFFHPQPLYRPFGSVAQQNEVLAELADPKFAPFVLRQVPGGEFGPCVRDALGGLLVAQAGYVDTRAMLAAWQAHLLAGGSLVQSEVADADLQLGDGWVEWRGIRARRAIFCRGHHDRLSPWWQWLPFRPVKGEILWLRLAGTDLATILNRGCWVVPTPTSEGWVYKVGATYDWRQLDTQPTSQARDGLLAQLAGLVDRPAELVDHQAGIRPATADRKPLVGLHPEHPQLGIFGGLGAKGVSLAPFFAEQFYQFLAHGRPLDAEVDIRRYFCP